MAPKVVVVGSANTDFTVHVPELPAPGETVIGGRFLTARGGKGANQAVGAARLGAKVTFVARLGDDRLGQEALQAYRQEGIDTQYLCQDEHEPSGVALILVNQKGENMIAVAPGANHRLTPQDVQDAEPAIRQADVLLLQLEIPLDAVRAAVDTAYHSGVRIILNPAPARSLPDELLKAVSVLTPNQTELKALLGENAPQDVEAATQQLYEKSDHTDLVVTLGSQGALLCTAHGIRRIPAFPIQPVDTTGSGDAFNAALAVSLARGVDLAEAVHYASGAGALAATRSGAQPSLPTQEELDDFLRSRQVAG